jgi:omega-amidase
MENLLVSIIQSDIVWQNINDNLHNFDNKIDKVAKSDIIILPEMFNTGFSLAPEQLFETMKGETINWMRLKAKQNDAIIAGTMIIKENNEFYNRFVIMYPSGEYDYYDKRHLFRMADEHKHYSQGEKKLIIYYKGWKIRPLVCYDLRFPVWSRNTRDYDVLIYTANWPETRRFQWRTLLTARAIENQAYTIGVNRIGIDGNKFEYSGDSVVLSPIGETLLNTELNKEEVKTIELDYNRLLQFREFFPVSLDADKFEIIR